MKKIKRLLVDINSIRYRWWGKFTLLLLRKRTVKISDKVHDGKIVSLTSYPKRISQLHYVIISLLRQSERPEKIILWLAKDEMGTCEIPQSLQKLTSDYFEIKWVDNGLKSYDKLIHSLKLFPDYDIVTCDDDCIYPRNWFKVLVENSIKYPNEILCYRCVSLLKKSDTEFEDYSQIMKTKRLKNLMPTGVSGVFYPARSLDDEVFNTEYFLRYCPHADDIWFKAMSVKKGTPVRLINNKRKQYPKVNDENDSECLYFYNVVNGGNNLQLHQVFTDYNLYSKLDW